MDTSVLYCCRYWVLRCLLAGWLQLSDRVCHIPEVSHQNPDPNPTVVHENNSNRSLWMFFSCACGKRWSSEVGGALTAPRQTRWQCSTWCGSPTWRCSSLKRTVRGQPASKVPGQWCHVAGCCWWCNTCYDPVNVSRKEGAAFYSMLWFFFFFCFKWGVLIILFGP